ncbi:MAG: 30S ribosomal protein S16 [bacterium]|nr:30S ribosomal protein S16 [bacterium]
MLVIRLQRVGKKNKASFRIVLQDKQWKPQGKALELFGFYDPHSKEKKVQEERVKFWISKGAQVSPTLHNMFVGMNILSGEKVKVWKPKKGSDKKESAAPVMPVSESSVLTAEQPTEPEVKTEPAPVVSAETVESPPEEKTEVAV